jgi:hypothetical protein
MDDAMDEEEMNDEINDKDGEQDEIRFLGGMS